MLPSLSGGAIDLAVGGAATGGSIKRQGGANACFETALPADHHWRKRTHDASSSSSSRTWATTTSPAFSKSRSFRGAIAPHTVPLETVDLYFLDIAWIVAGVR